MVTSPVCTPYSAARRTVAATRAEWIRFLLGRQLMLGQEPPIQRRSTTTTLRPERARCQARYLPPSPLPRIRSSAASGEGMQEGSGGGGGWLSGLLNALSNFTQWVE